MIRVLHILHSLGGGGVEGMLYNYYSHFDRSAIHFDFIVRDTKTSNITKMVESWGSTIYHIPVTQKATSKVKNLFDYLAFIVKVRSLIRSKPHYDIVHCHMNLSSWPFLLFAKHANIPVRIIHGHTTLTAEGRFAKGIQSLRRALTKTYGTLFLACGERAAQVLADKSPELLRQTIIIPNAIDEKQFRFNPKARLQIRNEFGLDEDSWVIGHVGMFDPLKNQVFLINVFSQLAAKYPEAKLILIGDGFGRSEIEQAIAGRNLENKVMLLGVRFDVPRLYQIMDVFVFPSKHEGFPVATIEAQASGLPIITSTGVPTEIAITESVRFLDLTEPIEVWAKAIEDVTQGFIRKEQTQALIDAHLDITTASKMLSNLYLEQHNKGKEKVNLR